MVPVGQRRAWCWCMCFGLAFMLAGVILGGAYLYKYFALQVSGKNVFYLLFFLWPFHHVYKKNFLTSPKLVLVVYGF